MTFDGSDTMKFEAIEADAQNGSFDGEGAGDHDVPFRFGFRPRAVAPYPFSTRQYARLLVLRSRIRTDQFGADDWQAA
jgi:hypothetical protein